MADRTIDAHSAAIVAAFAAHERAGGDPHTVRIDDLDTAHTRRTDVTTDTEGA